MKKVELTERQKSILAAIVKLHIELGEPIGSKFLCEVMEKAPSSATLRSEMSTLCDLGFLTQPHTSAGRVPTAAGYKLYIESLMPRDAISEDTRRYIDEALSNASCDPEKLPEHAGRALSEITGLPALCADITAGGPSIRRVELLRLGSIIAMMVAITSDGRSRSRLCKTAEPLSDALTEKFYSFTENKVLRRFAAELSPAYMQNAMLEYGIDSFSLMPLISALSVIVSDIEQSAVSVTGQSSLFGMSLDAYEANGIISLLNKRDTLMSLFSGDEPLGVVFGRETQFSALKPSSIVFAKYNSGKTGKGCLGVIGPIRMSYGQILPCIEYTAQRMNDLLCSTLGSMEE